MEEDSDSDVPVSTIMRSPFRQVLTTTDSRPSLHIYPSCRAVRQRPGLPSKPLSPKGKAALRSPSTFPTTMRLSPPLQTTTLSAISKWIQIITLTLKRSMIVQLSLLLKSVSCWTGEERSFLHLLTLGCLYSFPRTLPLPPPLLAHLPNPKPPEEQTPLNLA